MGSCRTPAHPTSSRSPPFSRRHAPQVMHDPDAQAVQPANDRAALLQSDRGHPITWPSIAVPMATIGDGIPLPRTRSAPPHLRYGTLPPPLPPVDTTHARPPCSLLIEQERCRMCDATPPLEGISGRRCVGAMICKPEPPPCEACQHRILSGGMERRFCCQGCVAGHPHSAGCDLGCPTGHRRV
jgi:hypothetical protein